ncbi:SdpI family protein [Saccharomonospora saliphila]|uniref:SdpI family protein n=1 Tax=Saccharomonospora saliphila TaxID=369829 RepID=UPI000361DFEC|nr:SdpI family protein [Saccharomonospora saliphila]
MDAIGGLVVFAVALVALAGVLHAVRRGIRTGTLERNPALGIRTAATTSSDAAWRAGHVAAGPWLLAAARTGYGGGAVSGVLIVLVALGVLPPPIAMVVPASALVVMVVLLVLGTRRANRAARRVTGV